MRAYLYMWHLSTQMRRDGPVRALVLLSCSVLSEARESLNHKTAGLVGLGRRRTITEPFDLCQAVLKLHTFTGMDQRCHGACPVELHACRYTNPTKIFRCHGLVPWRLTLAAISCERETSTAQGRGILLDRLRERCSDQRENSTGQARGI